MNREKTGKRTGTMRSPRNGAECPTGAHPGNTGGKKGRSGRKPNDFVAWCARIATDPAVWDAMLARARSGDIRVLEFAANYAFGKPKHALATEEESTVRIIIARDDETPYHLGPRALLGAGTDNPPRVSEASRRALRPGLSGG
jgi:hypothetical protein